MRAMRLISPLCSEWVPWRRKRRDSVHLEFVLLHCLPRRFDGANVDLADLHLVKKDFLNWTILFAGFGYSLLALIHRARTWKGNRRINASRRITEISWRQKPVSLTLTGRVGQRRPLDRSTVLSKKVCSQRRPLDRTTVLSKKVCSQRRTLTTTSVHDENF